MEIAEQIGEIAVDILADADGALLTVDDFESAVAARSPIHHIQWEAVSKRVDDGIALLFLVDKFALVRWTHIQLAAVGAHAILGIVFVTVCQFAHGYFV